MKRTTWLTRVLAVMAAALVSIGIWTAVDGTTPKTSTTGAQNTVIDASFTQSDDFLTRTPRTSPGSTAPSSTAPRYRTRAS